MADKDSRSGSRYGTADVVKWVDELHVPLDPALKAAFDAPDREGMPAIQVGTAEAKAIEMILRLVGARRVVELGTLAGFSAIHIARALPPGGMLWTVETEPLHVRVAGERIAAAGLSDRVTIVQGAALEVISSLEPHGPFDAVFLDADKGNYDKYGRWAATHLRRGGLLIADNAYYFGDLLDPNKPEAEAMRRFHQESKGPFDTVCLPTPDGLLVGVRR